MSEPRRWYRIERNADEASIDLYGEIGDYGVSAGDFRAELRDLDTSLIKLHINSPGGGVDDGIAIYNSLKSHSAEVHVYVDAMAASIASVIAMAGDRVVMAPHSRMMIHNAMAFGGDFIIGNADDFERVANDYQALAGHLRETSQMIAGIYAERTGKDAAHWQSYMDEEKRFTAQEAVDEGLADEVGRDTNLAAFKLAANFELKGFREANQIHEEIEAELSEIEPPESEFDEPEAPEPEPDITAEPPEVLTRVEARRRAVDEIIAETAKELAHA